MPSRPLRWALISSVRRAVKGGVIQAKCRCIFLCLLVSMSRGAIDRLC